MTSQPKMDHLNIGDFVWFCPDCQWQGVRNTQYMRPTHACPMGKKGALTDNVIKVVKDETHVKPARVDARGDRSGGRGDPVGLNRLRRARVAPAEHIGPEGSNDGNRGTSPVKDQS